MFLQAEAAAPNIFSLLMPFVIMLVVFYFILLRPQQRQQKQRQEMLAELKKGDKVITVGGVFGEITALREDHVTLKIADKVEVKMSRSGIGSVVKS